MLLNPEVQRKAHEELDAIVGRDRMPTFSDYDQLREYLWLPSSLILIVHLAYIRGIVKESLRLRPVDPVGLPHRSIEDDWYEGYYIPKGIETNYPMRE